MKAINTFIEKQIAYWEGDKEYHSNILKRKREQLQYMEAQAVVFPNGEERLPDSGALLKDLARELRSSLVYHNDNFEKAVMHLDILYTARDAKAANLYR